MLDDIESDEAEYRWNLSYADCDIHNFLSIIVDEKGYYSKEEQEYILNQLQWAIKWFNPETINTQQL